MTYILTTESHGEVESGFCATFTQFTRLGEYAFTTKHVCDLARHLAEQPSAKEAKILGYDIEKFWERQNDYMQELEELINEISESYLPELKKVDMLIHLEGKQGQIPVEDEINLHNQGKLLQVRVIADEDSISIGKYIIPALDFGRYATYLARGGLMGWLNDKKPDFAEPTIEAIRNSERKLYEKIRQEI